MLPLLAPDWVASPSRLGHSFEAKMRAACGKRRMRGKASAMTTPRVLFKLREPIGWKSSSRLETLEHKQLKSDDYKKRLKEAQLQLLSWQRRLVETKSNVIIVIEGPDAAGKGGAIKRIVEKLDPRLLKVHSIVKPTAEEFDHHYLWRFWNKLPPKGQIVIYDRSWYGRVLVERVEGFCSEAAWKRAYREINEFERQLMDDGTILLKFFLFITKDEQLGRFKARESDPYKHWKISDEDWRNRRHWKENVIAAEEMLRRTSTERAPWHVNGANFKWHTRVKMIRTIVDALDRAELRDSQL
jgi:polyphosphate kinase 2 (PPK2 family)